MKDQENITPIDQYVIDFVMSLRNKKDLTQDDIANILQVSRSFVKDVESRNERAKYNIRHINALADYFELSPRDFLPENPIPVNKSSKEETVKPKSPIKKIVVKEPAKRTAVKKK